MCGTGEIVISKHTKIRDGSRNIDYSRDYYSFRSPVEAIAWQQKNYDWAPGSIFSTRPDPIEFDIEIPLEFLKSDSD